jgi:hypothetical protein
MKKSAILKAFVKTGKARGAPGGWSRICIRKFVARPCVLVGHEFAFANSLPAAGRAPGIGAESPQDLHGQIRGLGAESPAPARSAGEAPEDSFFLRDLVYFLYI